MCYATYYIFNIHTNDPCNFRWKLCVEEHDLNVGNISRQQNKRKSKEKAAKIINRLWQHT